MSTQKKPLKHHAVTCIKRAIYEYILDSENAGLAYTVHCDREDCWNQPELINNYLCAVNVRENGFVTGDEEQRITLKSGQSICTVESILSIELEVYSKGCEDAIDVAMSIMADVMRVINNCKNTGALCAKRIDATVLRRDVETGYADKKAMITQSLEVQFDYAPCMPSLVFKRA